MLSNCYHGNDGCCKNFDFSLGYLFPGSMTVQCFITSDFITKVSSSGRRKVINDQSFHILFVSDHLNKQKKTILLSFRNNNKRMPAYVTSPHV